MIVINTLRLGIDRPNTGIVGHGMDMATLGIGIKILIEMPSDGISRLKTGIFSVGIEIETLGHEMVKGHRNLHSVIGRHQMNTLGAPGVNAATPTSGSFAAMCVMKTPQALTNFDPMHWIASAAASVIVLRPALM